MDPSLASSSEYLLLGIMIFRSGFALFEQGRADMHSAILEYSKNHLGIMCVFYYIKQHHPQHKD